MEPVPVVDKFKSRIRTGTQSNCSSRLADPESPRVLRCVAHRRNRLRRHGHCRRIRDWQPDDAIARRQVRHHDGRRPRDVAARGGDGPPLLAFADHIDRPVLVRFGLLSAAALAGALVHPTSAQALSRVSSVVSLLLTAVAQLTGFGIPGNRRDQVVALFGLVSGFFGGIAGNQGGLRSAALMAFGLPPLGFVATATSNRSPGGCSADPVYLALGAGPAYALGTHHGRHGRSPHRDDRRRANVLGLSPRRFGQTIGWAIGALGIWMLVMPL